MVFERLLPKSATELHAYLAKLHENRAEVVLARVDEGRSRLEIDLSGRANFFGYPDVYIPIRREKLHEAKQLVDRLLSQSNAGAAPSTTDAQALFDLIDPHGS
jgi:hypothetical protein